MPLILLDRLQRTFPLANKVADEIVCEETYILEKTIPRMLEVMQMVAKFACDYVKRGRFGRQSIFCIYRSLMVAEKTKDGFINSKDKETIDKMDGELTKVIEDFDRAMNIEALRLAKQTGKHPFSRSCNILYSVSSCRARAFACATRICQGRL